MKLELFTLADIPLDINAKIQGLNINLKMHNGPVYFKSGSIKFGLGDLASDQAKFDKASFSSIVNFAVKTVDDGLGNNNVHSIYVDGNAVYAATDGGLSISQDGGKSFFDKT